MADEVQRNLIKAIDRDALFLPTLPWCDPRRLDATFGGVMGKYTEQAKLAAVKEYCAGKAGLRDVAH
ncbi:hypothetical protein B1F70_21315, partial [Pseudomonas syringae]